MVSAYSDLYQLMMILLAVISFFTIIIGSVIGSKEIYDNQYKEKFIGTLFERSFKSDNIIQEIYYKGNTKDTCTIINSVSIGKYNNMIINNIIDSARIIYTSSKEPETCLYNAEDNLRKGYYYIFLGAFPLLIFISIITIVEYRIKYRDIDLSKME